MKIEKQSIGGIYLLLTFMAAPSFAVVPPSPSMEKDMPVSAEGSAIEKAAFRRSNAVIERLEDDTRRLEEVLNDLKEDSQDLKQFQKMEKRPNDKKNP